MISILHQIVSGVERPAVKLEHHGAKCIAFNDTHVECYDLTDRANVLWARDLPAIVDCDFIDSKRLLLSSKDGTPRVLDARSGAYAGEIKAPVRVNLRTRFGGIYPSNNSSFYLRTSHPFELVQIGCGSLQPQSSLQGESLSSIIPHPVKQHFLGIAETTQHEILFGTFEEDPYFCKRSFSVLPYIYAVSLSPLAGRLNILGSDGESTLIAVIQLETMDVARVIKINLNLASTVSQPGNEDAVYITPKSIPAIGEDCILVFRCGGNAIVVNTENGDQEELPNPHSQPVCSVSDQSRKGFAASADWSGKIVVWNTSVASTDMPTVDWDALKDRDGVKNSYDTAPTPLLSP